MHLVVERDGESDEPRCDGADASCEGRAVAGPDGGAPVILSRLRSRLQNAVGSCSARSARHALILRPALL